MEMEMKMEMKMEMEMVRALEWKLRLENTNCTFISTTSNTIEGKTHHDFEDNFNHWYDHSHQRLLRQDVVEHDQVDWSQLMKQTMV